MRKQQVFRLSVLHMLLNLVVHHTTLIAADEQNTWLMVAIAAAGAGVAVGAAASYWMAMPAHKVEEYSRSVLTIFDGTVAIDYQQDKPTKTLANTFLPETVQRHIDQLTSLLRESSEFAPQVMLVYGDRGMGKTHLVESIAGELRWSYFPIYFAHFGESDVDTGKKRLNTLFTQAVAQAPSLILFDSCVPWPKCSPLLEHLRAWLKRLPKQVTVFMVLDAQHIFDHGVEDLCDERIVLDSLSLAEREQYLQFLGVGFEAEDHFYRQLAQRYETASLKELYDVMTAIKRFCTQQGGKRFVWSEAVTALDSHDTFHKMNRSCYAAMSSAQQPPMLQLIMPPSSSEQISLSASPPSELSGRSKSIVHGALSAVRLTGKSKR